MKVGLWCRWALPSVRSQGYRGPLPVDQYRVEEKSYESSIESLLDIMNRYRGMVGDERFIRTLTRQVPDSDEASQLRKEKRFWYRRAHVHDFAFVQRLPGGTEIVALISRVYPPGWAKDLKPMHDLMPDQIPFYVKGGSEIAREVYAQVLAFRLRRILEEAERYVLARALDFWRQNADHTQPIPEATCKVLYSLGFDDCEVVAFRHGGTSSDVTSTTLTLKREGQIAFELVRGEDRFWQWVAVQPT